MRVKIEVGQVWSDESCGGIYKITRIGMHGSGSLGAWAHLMGERGILEEVFFAYLDENQSIDLHSSWVLLETPSKAKLTSKECPCGIFREDCDYHR